MLTDYDTKFFDWTRYVAIAAGNSHNLALKADGSLVTWGNETEVEGSPTGSVFEAVAAGNF